MRWYILAYLRKHSMSWKRPRYTGTFSAIHAYPKLRTEIQVFPLISEEAPRLLEMSSTVANDILRSRGLPWEFVEYRRMSQDIKGDRGREELYYRTSKSIYHSLLGWLHSGDEFVALGQLSMITLLIVLRTW